MNFQNEVFGLARFGLTRVYCTDLLNRGQGPQEVSKLQRGPKVHFKIQVWEPLPYKNIFSLSDGILILFFTVCGLVSYLTQTVYIVNTMELPNWSFSK